MECKEPTHHHGLQTVLVEIDTLWNVKIPAKSSIKRIDLCRNRYIVECKVLFSISCISDLFVEIDTLWNVKQYQGTPRHSLACRNRYIVECKVFQYA